MRYITGFFDQKHGSKKEKEGKDMRTGKGIILVLTIILMVCFSAAAFAATPPVTDGVFNYDVDVRDVQTPPSSKQVCGIYADGKTVTDQGTHNVTAKSNQDQNNVYGIYAINGGTEQLAEMWKA